MTPPRRLSDVGPARNWTQDRSTDVNWDWFTPMSGVKTLITARGPLCGMISKTPMMQLIQVLSCLTTKIQAVGKKGKDLSF